MRNESRTSGSGRGGKKPVAERRHGAYRLLLHLRIGAESSPSRGALRRVRETVTRSLLDAGFRFDPRNPAHRESGNESRYTIYRLPYEPVTAGEGVLRPEIQIETAVWPLRQPSVERQVTSFVAEALGRQPEISAIACASITETAAEKFVALTRRTGAEMARTGGPRDPTLIRHLYDLHILRGHYARAEVIALAREIMLSDVEAYGHQFPAYRDDPIKETLRAVAGLRADSTYAARYATFRRDMVYGEAPDFETAIDTLARLAEEL